MLKKINAYFAEPYRGKDFVIQQKVRVMTGICLTTIPSVLVLLFSQIMIDGSRITIPILITLGGGIIVLLILTGIRKGHFSKVAHILPVTALGAIWAVMIFEKGGIVERLDTVAMAIGFLSFTALVITRRTSAFFLYIGSSIIAFLLCTFYIKTQTKFSDDLLVEYIVDSLFGMVMVGVTSYLVFSINQRALDKATLSIKLAEDEAQKNKELSQTLEVKVYERTEELKTAIDELEIINAQLIQAHDALWGEMQLAKKIQTILLPGKPEISNYEVTAYMNPADEVGGDYYDIIHSGSYDWIAIGDVSGHGVPAGLVMMMVQTAVHLCLTMHPDFSPSELLIAINRVISFNIKKMGEDKYMTITVLACGQNGNIHFSGLHQDMMVYRANTKRIDLINTRGMWIGLMDDIDGMIKDDHLTLQSGDTMLLFTDGLTEARRKNNEVAFGEDRLEAILLDTGAQSTETTKSEILKALDNFTCTDDVTFLILKRN
ncbi:MAG: SpoIIE family protein phosphatase [Proteobacteria bacterium]|nr:SpoIIE family protein phosphatase [Pseudomonadota bacterium]